jgi:histidinol dehydrogenase
VQNAILELRAKLSPRGDVVSESSRQRTIDVFGSPLTPLQVVERICAEVRDEGTAAVLRYSSQLDKADLSADQLRVPAEELQAAHAGADPEFLETIRRIRPNVLEFQSAIPQGNVQVTRPGVRLTHRYGVDDGGSGPGRWRPRAGRRRPAHAIRRVQPGLAGDLP